MISVTSPGQQYTLKASQATRVFNLIQQIVPQPRNILNASTLTQFLDLCYTNHSSNSVKLIHDIDKQGKQMNQAYFGQCISSCLSQQHILFGQSDLAMFHLNLKKFLVGKYHKPFSRIQKWDQIQSAYSQQQVQTIHAKIRQLYIYFTTNNVYIDVSTIRGMLNNINILLTINTLHPAYKQEAIDCYRLILRGNFVKSLIYSLSNNLTSDCSRQLQCVAYISGALKHPEIYQILSKTELFSQDIWKILMNCYAAQGMFRLFTSIIAANFSKYCMAFCQFIWSSDYLSMVCSNIAKMNDSQGLQFSIQFIKNLIKCFPLMQIQWQKNFALHLGTMFDFTRQQLTKNVSLQTRMQCLNAIRQLITYYQLQNERLQDLKILSLIFQSNSTQLKLEAVHILETAMRYGSEPVIDLILSDANFVKFLKQCLNVGQNKTFPFFQGLYIAHLLSFSNHIKYFFEKELIQPIQKIGAKKSGFQSTIVSQILLNIVSNGLESEWRLSYIHEHKIMTVLSLLLQNTLMRQPFMSSYLKQEDRNSYVYFNKQTFINVFKCLYLLSETQSLSSMSTGNGKIALFVKNFQTDVIQGIHGALQNLFVGVRQKVVIATLKQQVTVQVKGKSVINCKVYKLIHLFIQNILCEVGQKQKDILRQVLHTKRSFYERIYSYLPITELEAHGIPIQMKVFLKFAEHEKTIRINCVQWSAVKSYIIDWLQVQTNMKISNIKAINMSSGKQINHDIQYRQILAESIKNYRDSKFLVSIQVQRIVQQQNRGDRLRVPGGTYEARGANSYANRFATTRVNNQQLMRSQRARTPNMERNMTSSYIYQRNSRSPIPNTQQTLRACINCGATTNNDYCSKCRINFRNN